MLPIVTGIGGSSTPTRRPRVAPRRRGAGHDALVRDLGALDELLFEPGAFFVVDDANERLPGVYPGSAAAGLALIGRGAAEQTAVTAAAAVVGRLRSGVRAVDIDLPEPQAARAAAAVTAWAHARGLETLTRPSGAPGHVHVLIAGLAGDDVDLDQLCADVRRDLGALPYSAVDPRRSRTLRTLTSPHRAGLPSPPPDAAAIAAFAAAARAVLTQAAPMSPRADHTTTNTTSRTTSRARRRGADPAPGPAPSRALGWGPVQAEPMVPRPRPLRPLPARWAHYLATAHRPPLGGGDHSQSTYEAIVTASAVRAGWTHEQTWAAIATGHPAAMTRALTDQGRWTTYVWNRAVAENDDAPGAGRNAGHQGVQSVDEGPADALVTDLAIARRRAWVWAATGLSPRARAVPLRVLDVVLHRMRRTDSRRVSVAQRDLHEDTGISCATIGAALDALEAAGVLQIDRAVLDRRPAARASTSYEAVLPPARPDDPEPTPRERALWETLAPSRHTPSPWVWAHLPRSCHRLHQALTTHGPTPHADLAPLALLTADPATTTPAEAATTRAALRALARAGLASCDAAGIWQATGDPVRPDLEQTAARARAARTRTITEQRQAYRVGGASDWHIARAAAVKRQRAKQQAWWAGLPAHERTERRAHYQARYAGLTLTEQLAVKDRLARSRAAAGIDEHDHQQRWVNSWTDGAWADRVAIRAAAHRARPGPLQRAQVVAWKLHRDRWALPRATRHGPPEAAAIPAGPTGRDEAFLSDQLPLRGELPVSAAQARAR